MFPAHRRAAGMRFIPIFCAPFDINANATMRIGRDQHHLVKAYAAERGISVRTAQLHRQVRQPEFLEFLSRQANAKVVSDANPVPQLNAMATPAPDSLPGAPVGQPSGQGAPDADREELMEQKAYESWRAVAEERNKAIVSRDPNIVAWCKAEAVAQESYRKAKRARENAAIATGRLIPAHVVAELRRRFILPLRAVIQNMPQEVGPRANPFDTSFGISACQEWVNTRFNAQLESAAGEILKYSPTA